VRRRVPALLLLCCASGAALATAGRDARADVSSFLAVGGGYSGQFAQGATTPDMASAITYSVGVGTSPLGSLVGAIMYRGATYVTLGTDVGMSLRLATGGYARGEWGVALDAGVLYRYWGNAEYGTWPLQGILTVGSPWGFQLALGSQVWDISGAPGAEGFFAALEIDLLRLTVTRQGPSERWWPNPNPAGGHPEPTPEPTPAPKPVGFSF
jgi:hypothetical protein